jgi:cytoskeletal protein RodZ
MSNLFKDKRESLAISIQEAAKVTRVKVSYLKAMEDEDFEKLPSFEVYSRGYIREYARFLGIAGDKAIVPYEKYIADKKRASKKHTADMSATPKIPEAQHAPAIVNESISHMPAPVYEKSLEKKQWEIPLPLRKFAWVLPVLAIVGVFYALSAVLTGNNTAIEQQPIVKDNRQEQAAESPAVTGSGQANTEQNVQMPPASGAELKPEVQPAAKKKYNLGIAASEITWLQVVLDETDKKEVVLYPGDSVSYDADRLITLLIGNAGGIKINFNGKEFSKIGEKGQVIKINLPEELSQFQQPQPPQSQNAGQKSPPQR